MKSTGVVAALAAEARTLGVTARRGRTSRVNAGTLVHVSGMGKPAARAAALALVEAGVTSLVSWGMAGGLDPALPAGTICLPVSILTEHDERFDTELHRREALRAAVAGQYAVNCGVLLTCERALESVAAKAAAYRERGAVAVDMESAEVARVALERGLPFVAVRVIVDTAKDSLPPAVMAASRNGAVSVPRLLWELACAPQDLPSLLRLSTRYSAAKASLRAVAVSGALAPVAFSEATPGRVA